LIMIRGPDHPMSRSRSSDWITRARQRTQPNPEPDFADTMLKT
jgi:hypothetical protein